MPPITAPAMPNSMVMMNPPGSRPGIRSFAITPTINPNTIQPMTPNIASSAPRPCKRDASAVSRSARHVQVRRAPATVGSRTSRYLSAPPVLNRTTESSRLIRRSSRSRLMAASAAPPSGAALTPSQRPDLQHPVDHRRGRRRPARSRRSRAPPAESGNRRSPAARAGRRQSSTPLPTVCAVSSPRS